jgi:hypothetical protein
VVILTGIVMKEIPSEVTASDPDPTTITYQEFFTTPVAAANKNIALTYTSAATIVDTTFVGTSYEELYEYILNETVGGRWSSKTNQSSNGLFYEAFNNFTVMYNATLPLNYPAVVTDVLNALTANVTKGRLVIETESQPFPYTTIDLQLNYGIIGEHYI